MCSLHKKSWKVSNVHPLLYQENINAKNLIYSFILADSTDFYIKQGILDILVIFFQKLINVPQCLFWSLE